VDTNSDIGRAGIASYLAIGDSFTEGLNDRLPDGAFGGWADRLAGHLDAQRPGLRYGNLAVRGRLLEQIVREQVPDAIRLAPELVSLAGGGNDILRPGSDPDRLAEQFEAAVERLRAAGSQVLVFTGFDTRTSPVLSLVRGKVATYNANLRAVADRNGCAVVDLWAMRSLHDRRAWSEDRLHLAGEGHRRVALRAALALGLEVDGDPDEVWPPERQRPAGVVRQENIRWAREYLVPWVGRRLRHESSGDGLTAKRPEMAPLRSSE
jgi:lysophospholipase L1-like esterase